jgi:hypothetical protein
MTVTGPSTSAAVPGLIPVGYKWSWQPVKDGTVRIYVGKYHVFTTSSMEAAQRFIWSELDRLFTGVYRSIRRTL